MTKLFRACRASSVSTILIRTSVQIVVFWGVFLFAIPAVIVWTEQRLSFPRFEFNTHRPLAVTLFVLASSMGLWSAWTMVTRGRGTPLPMDCPSHLIVEGPYRIVRNPMAVAGLLQGSAVGIWLGSWTVLAYVLLGGVIWHVCVRPIEERDLAARFGESYLTYRRDVKCWFPRL